MTARLTMGRLDIKSAIATVLVPTLLALSIAAAQAGNFPLPEAAKAGNLPLVKDLVAKGADPNGPDGEGKNALHEAAAAGHADILTFLLDHKGAINSQDSTFKETPLVEAAQFRHLDCVQLLLQRGADVQVLGKYGADALYAVVNNVTLKANNPEQPQILEIIRLLLADGANANLQNYRGETTLHMPAYANEVALVSFLLKSTKVNPNLKTKEGKTVLDYACEGKGDVEMFDLLSHAGFKCAKGLDSCLAGAVAGSKLKLVERLVPLTPPSAQLLAQAAAGSQPDDEKIALLLLQRGADFNAATTMQFGPLHGAAITDKRALADALLRNGAKLSTQGTSIVQGTPLHMAARFGNPEMVRILLRAGAKPNEANPYGETPLMMAVQGPVNYQPSDGPPSDWSKTPNYVKTIALLIDAGASMQARNQFGKTAGDILAEVRNDNFRKAANYHGLLLTKSH